MHNPVPHINHAEEERVEGKVLRHYKHGHENVVRNDDVLLWSAFLSGSKEAFSEIFLRHNPTLVAVGVRLGFARKTTEDCIQDLFLNLWVKRRNLSEVSSVKYYLIVSLRRSLLSQKEKETRISRLVSGIREEYPAIELPALWNDDLERHRMEFLFRSMDFLPKRQVLALKLRYIEQKTYPEIAGIMAIDVNSARKFVYKATKNLKNSLHSISRNEFTNLYIS